MKPARNAFFGYTYQKTIAFLVLAKMDIEREIEFIELEAVVNNNFDDIKIQIGSKVLYCQIKDYNNIKESDLKVVDNKIFIKGAPYELSNDINVIFVKEINTAPNSEILGMPALHMDGVYVVSISREEVWDIVSSIYYINEQRIPCLERFFDRFLDDRKLIIKRSDLPHIDIYSTELIDKTVKLQNLILNDSSIIKIEGKPGIGKSHLVNQLQLESNMILYRFWISNQDKNYKDRLCYRNFISNITKELFQNFIEKSEDEIISKLKQEKKTLVIDGLDHVENYNNEDLKLFIHFIERVGLCAKVIVLTRPLKVFTKWETILLNNWDFKQTSKFLDEIYHITDYDLIKKTYELTNGYPILVSYVAKHYKEFKVLPDINQTNDINEYYEAIIKNVTTKSALALFLCNRSYFMFSEIHVLVESELAQIISEFISSYPYLFDTRLNRISLVHDSFNTYLRAQNINYTSRKEIVHNHIFESIMSGNKRYLSRFYYFELPAGKKLQIVQKYSNIHVFRQLINDCVDFEAIQSFYYQVRQVLGELDLNSLNITQYYDLSLILNIINRDHLSSRNMFLFTYIHCLLENKYTEEDITSSEYLFAFLYYIRKNDIQLLKNILNDYSYDTENIYTNLLIDINEELTYFENYRTPIKLTEDIIEIFNGKHEYEVKDVIVDILISSYIHGTAEPEFEKMHRSIILYIDREEKDFAILMTKSILPKYGVRDFFAHSLLRKAKDELESMGLIRGKNDYRDLTLNEYIEKYSYTGSYELLNRIHNYLRISLKDKRTIDISSICRFWPMYYMRKDYSIINIDQALRVFELKKMIIESESCKIIVTAQSLSEKGIRHLLEDYIQSHEIGILKLLEDDFELDQLEVDWLRLPVEHIDAFSENMLCVAIHKILKNYSISRKIDISYIENGINSKKGLEILEILKLAGYTIEISQDHILINMLKKSSIDIEVVKENENSIVNKTCSLERYHMGILTSTDIELIKELSLNCYDLAAYTNGFLALLADIDIFAIYPKDEIQKNIDRILYNAFLGRIKNINTYGNVFYFVGNLPLLFFIYDINVDWIKLYSSFMEFLELSLIQTNK